MNTNQYPPVQVRVAGPYACFTRAELKVERVTYSVLTPSAARGILEQIYWKPQFFWRVVQIDVLKPIKYFNIVRNEVLKRANVHEALRGKVVDASDNDTRVQRFTLGLRDVAYVIHAQAEVIDGDADDEIKHRDQFRRRVRQGRCYAMPYLGCREFSAAFSEPVDTEQRIMRTEDLGTMILDFHPPDAAGIRKPRFFNACLDHGSLHVDWEASDVLEASR